MDFNDFDSITFPEYVRVLNLNKYQNNTYRFYGEFYLRTINRATEIEVDGVKYVSKSNEHYEVINLTDEYYDNSRTDIEEYDNFKSLGINIKVEYPRGLFIGECYSPFIKNSKNIHQYSENSMVNLLLFLFENLRLKEKGLNINFGKCGFNNSASDLFILDVLERSVISQTIFGYGYNNTVSIDVPLRYIYDNKLNIDQIIECNEYTDLSKKFFSNIGYETNLLSVIKLFDRKAKYLKSGVSHRLSWSEFYMEQIKTNIINKLN